MSFDEFFTREFSANPVMGIFRGLGVRATVDLCQRAWDFGVELVEVPIQDDAARPAFEAALAAGLTRGKAVGAGTVTSAAQVAYVLEAGGAFTVSPGTDESVIEASLVAGLPHLPGVATATEVGKALRLGCVWQKAFPAAQLGPGWVNAVRAPFPAVKFVATGGVRPQNARSLLDAGCSAIAVGSAFDSTEAIAELARELGGHRP